MSERDQTFERVQTKLLTSRPNFCSVVSADLRTTRAFSSSARSARALASKSGRRRESRAARDPEAPRDDVDVDVRRARDLLRVADAVDVGDDLLHGEVPGVVADEVARRAARGPAQRQEVLGPREEHGHLPRLDGRRRPARRRLPRAVAPPQPGPPQAERVRVAVVGLVRGLGRRGVARAARGLGRGPQVAEHAGHDAREAPPPRLRRVAALRQRALRLHGAQRLRLREPL